MAKQSIKEKIKQAQARTRAAFSKGGAMLGNMKPLAIAGVGGAAADWGSEKLAEQFDFVRNNWYGRAAAMFGLALIARKKSQHAALGIAGAAGARARQDYGASSPYGGTTTNVLPKSALGAQALQDGSEVLYGDTSALQDVVNA